MLKFLYLQIKFFYRNQEANPSQYMGQIEITDDLIIVIFRCVCIEEEGKKSRALKNENLTTVVKAFTNQFFERMGDEATVTALRPSRQNMDQAILYEAKMAMTAIKNNIEKNFKSRLDQHINRTCKRYETELDDKSGRKERQKLKEYGIDSVFFLFLPSFEIFLFFNNLQFNIFFYTKGIKQRRTNAS